MTVGMEELLELFDLILKDEALVSVSDKYAVCGVGLDNRGAGDVLHVLNGFAGRAEGLVLDQMEALRIEDQGVACNTRAGLISTAEPTIDEHDLASGLYGMLTLDFADRDMTIDDVRLGALQIELFEDHITDLLLGAVDIVVALLFVVCGLVGDEVALEGSHRRLVEER